MVDYQEFFETKTKVHEMEMEMETRMETMMKQISLLQEMIEVVLVENERLRKLLTHKSA